MEVKDIITIQSFEEYLNERNYHVNSFEEALIQKIWPFLRDRHLFFLIKNPHYPTDFEWLRNTFYDKIEGKYSNHYPPGILRANPEGDFWARVPILYWKPVKNEESNLFSWQPVYEDVWQRFDKIFQLSKDYDILYQDEHLQIITFLLKLHRAHEMSSMKERRFYRDSFCPNPFHSCDVIKSYHDYDYFCYSSAELINMIGLNEFVRLEDYYRHQRSEVDKKIRARNK